MSPGVVHAALVIASRAGVPNTLPTTCGSKGELGGRGGEGGQSCGLLRTLTCNAAAAWAVMY